MKIPSIIFLFMLPLISNAQSVLGDRLKPGFIIDRFGDKYEGLLKLEPGNDKKSGELIFKENKKGRKEVYKPAYIKSFVIETDSFATLKNFPIAKQKNREADFAKVEMVGPGGVVYSVEYTVAKSSGHAATEYVIDQENVKFFIKVNNKLSPLSHTNFKDVAIIVADNQYLKTRIVSKKLKYADLRKVIDTYKTNKPQEVSTEK